MLAITRRLLREAEQRFEALPERERLERMGFRPMEP